METARMVGVRAGSDSLFPFGSLARRALFLILFARRVSFRFFFNHSLSHSVRRLFFPMGQYECRVCLDYEYAYATITVVIL